MKNCLPDWQTSIFKYYFNYYATALCPKSGIKFTSPFDIPKIFMFFLHLLLLDKALLQLNYLTWYINIM